MKKTLYLGILILLTIACKKTTEEIIIPKPTVSFNFSENAYGFVTFSTTATNADYYSWNFGDGGSSDQLSPTHVYNKNGNFSVTVTATGKGGTTTMTRTVTVRNVSGSVVFWKSDSRYNIDVTVDDKYLNTITGYYSSGTPDCGSQYCATFPGLTEGVHTFTAKEKGRLIPSTWKGTLTIIGGSCSKMQLTY